MSKKDTVTKAFMRENTVFADAFNRIRQVPCFHCEKLAAAVQEVKKNAWYEKERLNMEEHLSTDTSDPISVIKDYIRSHLSDPELGRTSIAEEIHMNPDYLSHIFSTKTGASLSSYIMDERMAAAKRLLATTSFSPSRSATRSESQTFPTFTGSSRKAAG